MNDKEYIKKEDVENALNECFEHTLTYKGYIQIFSNAIYQVDGKKILRLYEKLGLENKVRDKQLNYKK